MSIATLSLCYNNHDVFTSVVKMDRKETETVSSPIFRTHCNLDYCKYGTWKTSNVLLVLPLHQQNYQQSSFQ